MLEGTRLGELHYKIKQWFNPRALDKLIKKAERKHKETGKQYLIMPTNGKGGGLILVHGTTFLNDYNKKAKKLGYPKMTFVKLLSIAVYKTNPSTLNKR